MLIQTTTETMINPTCSETQRRLDLILAKVLLKFELVLQKNLSQPDEPTDISTATTVSRAEIYSEGREAEGVRTKEQSSQ